MIRLKWRAEAELFGLRSDFAPVAAEAVELRAGLADATERAERAERALDVFMVQRRVRAGLALGRMADWLRAFGRRK